MEKHVVARQASVFSEVWIARQGFRFERRPTLHFQMDCQLSWQCRLRKLGTYCLERLHSAHRLDPNQVQHPRRFMICGSGGAGLDLSRFLRDSESLPEHSGSPRPRRFQPRCTSPFSSRRPVRSAECDVLHGGVGN